MSIEQLKDIGIEVLLNPHNKTIQIVAESEERDFLFLDKTKFGELIIELVNLYDEIED